MGITFAAVLTIWSVTSTPPGLEGARLKPVHPIAFPQVVSPTPAQADVQQARIAARSAQREFERIRRNHLPVKLDAGSTPCDEVIGRFCLWHGGDDAWEPIPEPSVLTTARDHLIAELESTRRVFPGDWWISGQLVRYLVEAGQSKEAVSAAHACAADSWWCLALQGYALHESREYELADSAFAAAMRLAPAEERPDWTDVSVLLERGASGRYRRLSEAEQGRFEERFWWLADPLYLVPGNERRTEHFSRLVMDRIQDDARSPFGVPWGWDLREIVLRYGWPAGWERVRASAMAATGSISVISHFAKGGRQFVPPEAFVTSPDAIGPEDWPLERLRPRAEFATRYAASFELLEHQIAAFRRGDSTVVVGAYDLRDSDGGSGQNPSRSLPNPRGKRSWTPDANERIHAALFLVDSFGVATGSTRTLQAGPRGVLRAAATGTTVVVSLEMLAPESERAGRARYSLRQPPLDPFNPSLSDLLILERPDPLPETLEAAVAATKGSTRVSGPERIGVFFELYGLRPVAEPAAFALSVGRSEGGWLRRAARTLRLVGGEQPIVLRWTEEVQGGSEPFARALTVDLPELASGAYSLYLEVTLPGRTPISVSREIRIER